MIKPVTAHLEETILAKRRAYLRKMREVKKCTRRHDMHVIPPLGRAAPAKREDMKGESKNRNVTALSAASASNRLFPAAD